MPFRIKSNFIRNCASTKSNVIRIAENSSFFIDKECNVISNICAEYDGFSSAMVKHIIIEKYFTKIILQSNVIARSGMQVFYNKTFSPCVSKTDYVKFSLKAIAGFPHWENCSTKGGKFCDVNKKISSISPVALKTLETFQSGDVRINYYTRFDGGRVSCTSADFSVAKY